MVFVVIDTIVIFRKIKTILILMTLKLDGKLEVIRLNTFINIGGTDFPAHKSSLISFKCYFSHPEKSILNLSLP